MMITVCDICGKRINATNKSGRLFYDDGHGSVERDICASCFNRIRAEIETENEADCPYREYPCATCDEQADCQWK